MASHAPTFAVSPVAAMRALPFAVLLAVTAAASAQIPASAYQDLEYRLIGPFRAGRTVGAVGVPSQPNVFYIGVNNGGVWKTDDYGRTWAPIFDGQATGSIGDVAVSASDPNVLYVGSGEGLHRPDLSTGDGMFKSTDGGATWQHIGLGDVQQIARVVIHPTDPNTVFVAAMGHPYGASEERGVYRTRDGGRTWEKVLYVNATTTAHAGGVRPAKPAKPLRRPLGPPGRPVGERELQRPWLGPLQVHRRRHDVAPAHERPARRRRGARPHRLRDRAERPAPDLRHRRRAPERRHLPLRRRWRHVDAHRHGRARVGARGRLCRDPRPSHRTPTACLSPTRPRTAPTTAGTRGRPSRARPAATTTTASGSTPRTRT